MYNSDWGMQRAVRTTDDRLRPRMLRTLFKQDFELHEVISHLIRSLVGPFAVLDEITLEGRRKDAGSPDRTTGRLSWPAIAGIAGGPLYTFLHTGMRTRGCCDAKL